MNTYLVIETTNSLGRVAYVETVSPFTNIHSYSCGGNHIYSISAYTKKKDAQAQVDFLNKLYEKLKEQN